MLHFLNLLYFQLITETPHLVQYLLIKLSSQSSYP